MINSELEELGLSFPQEEDTPKSVLEHFKSMSSPVIEHRVTRGDTLSEIAMRYGTTVREIARLNPHIKDVNKIRVGEKIDIPSSTGKEIPLKDYSPIDYSMLSSKPSIPSIEEDAIEQSTPEELIPLLKGLGAAGMAASMPSVLAALAKRAPTAAPVSGVGANLGSNVRAYGSGTNAQMLARNKMTTNSMYQRPMADTIKPNPQRSLASQARNLNTLGPEFYPGKITTPLRNEALGQSIRKAMLKMQGRPDPRANMLDDMLGQPTLGDLVREGSKPSIGADVPFQELLKRVGYKR